MGKRSPSISRDIAIDNAKEEYSKAMDKLKKQTDKEMDRTKNKFKKKENKLRATYNNRVIKAQDRCDAIRRRK